MCSSRSISQRQNASRQKKLTIGRTYDNMRELLSMSVKYQDGTAIKIISASLSAMVILYASSKANGRPYSANLRGFNSLV